MFDDRMFGKLGSIKPLTQDERRQLRERMSSDWDRRTFERIERVHQPTPAPAEDNLGRPLTRESKAVWAFGNELNRRIEARELRKLAERVQERDRQRLDRQHSRQC
ncbi:MAG TPA: hypothetical protein PLW75_02295 [Hyphomicrobium sp.]|nr:hypothetical protein [Hyphomicrobium sp.]